MVEVGAKARLPETVTASVLARLIDVTTARLRQLMKNRRGNYA